MHADQRRWNRPTSACIGVHPRFQTHNCACSIPPAIETWPVCERGSRQVDL